MEDGMEQAIEKTLKSLEARNLRPWFAKDCEEARNVILDLIPRDAAVGVGDSSSVRQIGVIEELEKRGARVFDPFALGKPITDSQTYVEFLFRPMIEATLSDTFLTGINAITQDGRLLSIDGAGNRVAGMAWGHPQVVLAVGKNKIVEDLDAAFDRLKNVIVPEHVRRRGISGPPCGVTGKCHDCVGRTRICAITTLIEGKPLFSEINVIIVDEDLGLGWSPSWSQGRIDKIAANHERFMWTLPWELGKALDTKDLWEGVKAHLRSKPE
jgi:hypothetical protein